VARFALFFNSTDFNLLGSLFQDARFSAQERRDGSPYWNGGLSGWATLPIWPTDYPWYNTDLQGRILVIDTGATGPGLDDFLAYLRRVGLKYPWANHLYAIASNATPPDGCLHVWPRDPANDPWAGIPMHPASETPPPGPGTPTNTTTAGPDVANRR